MSETPITEDEKRGEISKAGYANSEIRRNPDQPTADEGAAETSISPSAGDTPEDLIDRVDDRGDRPR